MNMLLLYYCGFFWLGAGLTCLGEEWSAPLGYPIEITDVYIEGGRVEPIPRTDRSASLVVRLVQVRAAQDGFRYDFSIYGLDAGEHNLGSYLQSSHSTGSVLVDIPIQITTKHSLETLPKPEMLLHRSPKRIGGYRSWLIFFGVLWILGLVWLVFYRKRASLDLPKEVPQVTLKEKLQQLVTAASRGELSEAEQAKLERLIIGHWKNEIPAIESLPAAKAMIELRRHPEASLLILMLEQWLHAPERQVDQAEIEPLLEPFGNLQPTEHSE